MGQENATHRRSDPRHVADRTHLARVSESKGCDIYSSGSGFLMGQVTLFALYMEQSKKYNILSRLSCYSDKLC